MIEILIQLLRLSDTAECYLSAKTKMLAGAESRANHQLNHKVVNTPATGAYE